jgi:hypothetical protein
MRIPLQAFLVAFAAIRSASSLTLPDLPPPVFADTEVSTNVATRVWTERTRMFNVVLSFDATPSNNVQAAFGADASADGNLSDEEAGLTLGWDCGEWFIASADATNRFTAAPAGTETRKELRFQMTLGADGLPRALELTDGTTPLAFAGLNLSPPPPAWMFSKDWNLLKVVARGTDVQNEQIVVELTNDAVMLLLR